MGYTLEGSVAFDNAMVTEDAIFNKLLYSCSCNLVSCVCSLVSPA